MTFIVCVDDRMGLSFGKRRLSRDSALCRRISEIKGGAALYVSEYSRPLFEGICEVSLRGKTDSPKDGEGYYFFENEDPSELFSGAGRIVIYKWNRRYPSDVKLTYLPWEHVKDDKWFLSSSCDFRGSSHERITEETWERRPENSEKPETAENSENSENFQKS